MDFSPQQKSAIEKRDASVILGAAAGSGKTTVMVTRIAQMLTEGRCSAKELLVLTFTRAAASNMLFKLEEKLSLMEHPLAKKAVRELPYAQISTFDSFCTALVRRYFYLLDIQADARMLDQNEADEFASDVVEKTVEEASQLCEGGEFDSLELLYSFFSKGKQDEKLIDAVQSIYKHIRLYPDPEARLLEICGSVDISKYTASDIRYVKKRIAAGMDAIEHEKKMAMILGADSAAALNVAEADKEQYNRLLDAKSIHELKPEFVGLNKKEYKISDAQNKEIFYPIRETVKKQAKFDDIIKGYAAVTEDGADQMGLIYSALGRLVKMYSDNMEKEFLRRNVLTFDVCQHLALRLLDITQVAQELRDTYKYIFVDEDQDSNRMQRNMLDRLANTNKSNLFMVGDIKQSIYRFRNAEPELFIENIESYASSKDGFSCVMRLNNNFRSHKNVLESVNLIFKHNMRSDFFQIDYNSDEELVPPPNDKEQKAWQNCDEYLHPTQVVLIENDTEELKKSDLDVIEAMEAASLVKQHLGTPIACGNGKTRPAELGDIAILALKANKLAPIYTEVFAKAGIPFVPSGDLSVFDSYEVSCVLDLLRLIDNRLDDYAMFSVMRLYGFTFDEIIDIRSKDKKSSFSKCIIDCQRPTVKELLKEIERLRFLCACKPIWKVVWEIYDSTGIYARCAALPDGRMRTANLREFAAFAEKYCSGEGMSLGGFIKLCSGDNKPVMMTEAEVSDNRVHMLTIHKSKGLEFPIVILVGCGDNLFSGNKEGAVTVSKELGLGINPEIKNSAGEYIRSAIKRREKELLRSEHLRNLYVALTRAVNKLIVVGKFKPFDIIYDSVRHDASSFFDFILPPVLSQPECSSFAVSKGIMPIDCEHLGSWECRRISATEVEQVYYKPATANDVAPDATLTEAAYNNMRFEYHHKAASELAVKAGASDSGKSYELTPPDFLGSVSGAGIGSAYHAILEHTDFVTDPKITLDKLVKSQMISQQIADKLDLDKLRRLFASELGKELAINELVREAPFTMMEQKDGEKYIVQGIIDCFYVLHGKAVLIDFKSDRTADGIEMLTQRYRPQLELYKKALKKCFGLECERASLYFIDSDARVDI